MLLADSHLTTAHGRADRCAGGGDRVQGGDGRNEIRQTRMWRPERCVWNALKRQDFPVLSFSGRAKLALGAAEDGSPKVKCCSDDDILLLFSLVVLSSLCNTTVSAMWSSC
jgi:hypothetical protein